MRRAAVPLAGGGLLLLAACGAPPATVVPSPLGSSVSITAEPATCAPADGTQVCTVKVWYANTSRSDVDIDPTGTELVDKDGVSSFPVVSGSLPDGTRVQPGDKFAVTWSLTLPADSTVSAVVWRGLDGTTQSAQLAIAETGATSTLSASPTATPTPTPAASTKPKPKPTPATSKPVNTQGGNGGGGGGGSTPPPSGSIG